MRLKYEAALFDHCRWMESNALFWIYLVFSPTRPNAKKPDRAEMRDWHEIDRTDFLHAQGRSGAHRAFSVDTWRLLCCTLA
jgi:hypothetical protein